MKRTLMVLLLLLYALQMAAFPCAAATNSKINNDDLEFLDAFVPIYSFQAVSVDESGGFAVLSRYQKETGFNKAIWNCVEVFWPDASFRTAIRFADPGENYLRLDGDILYIYQAKETLTIDLTSRSMKLQKGGYLEGIQEDLAKELRKSSFKVGSWQYSCKRSISGYTGMQRTDGTQTQILLQLGEAPQLTELTYVIIGFPIALLLIGLTIRLVRKNWRKESKK